MNRLEGSAIALLAAPTTKVYVLRKHELPMQTRKHACMQMAPGGFPALPMQPMQPMHLMHPMQAIHPMQPMHPMHPIHPARAIHPMHPVPMGRAALLPGPHPTLPPMHEVVLFFF